NATCVGSLATVCAVPSSGALDLSGRIDTDTDQLCHAQAQPAGPTICVIAAETIVVDPHGASAIGSRPPAPLAPDPLGVAGTLNASSTSARRGAGADDASCVAGDGASDAVNGGGGGAGGSFGAPGGGGGKSGPGTAGGIAAPPTSIAFVRGGCPGGDGGI